MVKQIFPIGSSVNGVAIDSDTKEMQEIIGTFNNDHGSQNSKFWSEARTDALIEAGDQTALRSLGFRRVLDYLDMYTSNRVRPVTSLVSGLQRRNRKSTIIIPEEDASQQTADQFSKIIYKMNTAGSILEKFSDGFQTATISGLALMQLWIDYSKDQESGTIKADICPYSTFMIDSTFRKPDLSDCSAIWKRSYRTKEECKALLPGQSEKVDRVAGASNYIDNTFTYLASTYINKGDYLTYDEYYYRDFKTKERLVDSNNNKVLDYNGPDDVLEFFLKENPNIIREKVKVPTVTMAILVNGIVFYRGPNLLGTDSFPFAPIFGKFRPDMEEMYLRFQGIPRSMRDMQYLYNLMTSFEVEFVQSRLNQGIIYKPGSLADPESMKRRDLSGNIPLSKSGRIEDIMFVAPQDIPSSLPIIREQAARDMVESEVGNEEVMGTTENDTMAAHLAMLRQTAGQIGLIPLLDNLDGAQHTIGTLQLQAIQKNYTPEKIMRIIGEQPTEEFYSRAFSEYGVSVEEGIYTSTQKQQQYAQLMQMREKGIQIPDELIIQASTIQDKGDVVEYMQNVAQQAQQAQEEEAQINKQLQMSEAALASSQAELNQAKAGESEAKSVSNITQSQANLAEANKDDEQATLDKIKAIQELQTIDLSQLEKFISIVNSVKAMEHASVEEQQKVSAPGVELTNQKR